MQIATFETVSLKEMLKAYGDWSDKRAAEGYRPQIVYIDHNNDCMFALWSHKTEGDD